MSAVSSSAGMRGENKEGQTAPEDSPSTSEEEKPIADKDESANVMPLEAESAESAGSYPSADEISAALEEEKGTVYWLAPAPAIPDVCQTLNAETFNTETLWNTILDRVFENADMTEEEMPEEYQNHRYVFSWNDQTWNVEISGASISLRSDASIGEDIQDSILDTLTELTGMSVSFETGEADHYAFTCNGLMLDEYGYSPGGDEWIVESKVSLDDNSISIMNPVVLQGDGENIGTESFVDMDSVREIYEAYWMASGLSTVSVVTGVELVYYFRDGQLLPAWRLTGQFYHSENGHDFCALLDAVTGEIVRDT